MFEKLKKLIFDETETYIDEPVEIDETDSLENNTNLRKTQPIVKPVKETQEYTHETKPVEPIEVAKVEPVPVSEMPKMSENSFKFKRVDVDEETKTETKEEEVSTVSKTYSKPVVPTRTNKPKKSTIYKPRPVISPMFGMSQEVVERKKNLKQLSKQVAPEKDEKVISPMYGSVTAEQEVVGSQKKKKNKSVKGNMSLEEMLNMQSSDELEFTLFDVKVDKDEFQSRENKTVKE